VENVVKINPEISFGKNLRNARNEAKMTQKVLADRSGIDRATISLIENDKESPRTKTVLKLAEVLGLNPGEFYRSEEINENNYGKNGDYVIQKSGEKQSSVEEEELIYEPIGADRPHPGLEALLEDDRMRLMLNLTSEEEIMLKSIRTRHDAPLGKDFFLDVLISYRRHHSL
jgi:transcriptional regulator with XRE-family HTH domain